MTPNKKWLHLIFFKTNRHEGIVSAYKNYLRNHLTVRRLDIEPIFIDIGNFTNISDFLGNNSTKYESVSIYNMESVLNKEKLIGVCQDIKEFLVNKVSIPRLFIYYTTLNSDGEFVTSPCVNPSKIQRMDVKEFLAKQTQLN